MPKKTYKPEEIIPKGTSAGRRQVARSRGAPQPGCQRGRGSSDTGNQ